MKEIERQEVVKRIKKDIEKIELLMAKCEKLNQLTENPIVKEYLDLLEDIKCLEEKLEKERMNSVEKATYKGFAKAFQNKGQVQDMQPCKHEIWMYEGSYYLIEDPRGERDAYIRTNTEEHENFEYNRYMCLECAKSIDTPQWRSFEDSHFVLKNQESKPSFMTVYGYINTYYQLLYNMSIKEAQEKLVEQFNRDKTKKK